MEDDRTLAFHAKIFHNSARFIVVNSTRLTVDPCQQAASLGLSVRVSDPWCKEVSRGYRIHGRMGVVRRSIVRWPVAVEN